MLLILLNMNARELQSDSLTMENKTLSSNCIVHGCTKKGFSEITLILEGMGVYPLRAVIDDE